jgi:hypothetical protein
VKNVQEVTAQLSDVFAKLKAGELDCKNADALANVAGKLIKVNLGQLQYYELRKEQPDLSFWTQQKP